MKQVYCSNCGTRLAVTRKAMPKYGRIIDLIEYHECPDEPVEVDLTPVDIPTFVEGGDENKRKFAQKLDELQPPTALGALSTNDLRDRRKTEDVKSDIGSTAPSAVLDQVKLAQNTTPAHNPDKEPNNE